ncbi:unnamed protein product [Schistosoma rodhaini]|nr:unnamed protein product [Schistosoma rodhaini]
MTDSNILKRVWEGKVPACFTLALEDLAHEDHAPPPIYMFLPRVSYFPLVTEKVIRQFSQFSECALKTASKDMTSETRGKLEHEMQYAQSDQIDTFKQHPLVHEFWLEYAHQPLKC